MACISALSDIILNQNFYSLLSPETSHIFYLIIFCKPELFPTYTYFDLFFPSSHRSTGNQIFCNLGQPSKLWSISASSSCWFTLQVFLKGRSLLKQLVFYIVLLIPGLLIFSPQFLVFFVLMYLTFFFHYLPSTTILFYFILFYFIL